MTSARARFAFLNLPNGMYRLGWYGPLSYGGTATRYSGPNIELAFSPFGDKGKVNTGHVIRRLAPIGYLSQMTLGSVWEKTEPVFEGDDELFECKVSIDDSVRLIKAGLPDETTSENAGISYNLPFDQYSFHRHDTETYCCSVAIDDCSRLIIPCTELVRFYFGSSSRLLSRLFSVPCDASSLYSKPYIHDLTKQAFVQLAPDLPSASAEDIARIAFDAHATSAVAELWKSLAIDGALRRRVFPRMRFPFRGDTRLLMRGRWLAGEGIERYRFVVHQILSCDHPFPFKALRYKVSTEVGTTIPESQPSKTERKKKILKTDLSVFQEEDPKTSKSTPQWKIKARSKFPDLINKPVWSLGVRQAASDSYTEKIESRERSVGKWGGGTAPSAIDLTEDDEGIGAESGELWQDWLPRNFALLISRAICAEVVLVRTAVRNDATLLSAMVADKLFALQFTASNSLLMLCVWPISAEVFEMHRCGVADIDVEEALRNDASAHSIALSPDVQRASVVRIRQAVLTLNAFLSQTEPRESARSDLSSMG
ncbi:MAG: hypothetical protein JWN23_988 [Rhodocyclales bacterium]|nr:hypothetical protein [Rhodocyclales bacterium]